MYATCNGNNHVSGCEHLPCRNWVERAFNRILPATDKTGGITFSQAAALRSQRRANAVNALRGNK